MICFIHYSLSVDVLRFLGGRTELYGRVPPLVRYPGGEVGDVHVHGLLLLIAGGNRYCLVRHFITWLRNIFTINTASKGRLIYNMFYFLNTRFKDLNQ